MSLHRVALLCLLSAALFSGCGDDKETSPAPFGATPDEGKLDLVMNGGNSSGGSTGNGGGGGTIVAGTAEHPFCRGSFLWGLNPAPLPPTLPATPTTGTEIGSWSGTQTVASGNALVNGAITATTPDTRATLNVQDGDLVINGSITTGAQTSLVLNVAGTLFIHGTIKTGRTDGTDDGEIGGNVWVFALRVIFTGHIDTRGEDNPAGNGGFGGSVNFCTDGDTIKSGTGQTSQLFVGGTLEMQGGNGNGPGSSGGSGGNFQTSRDLYIPNNGGHYAGAADGVVFMVGTSINVNGGSATGTGKVSGGSAGFMYWMGDSGFFFNGTASGIGGSATSTNGEARGGAGTALFINEFTIGDSGPIGIYGSITISGGSATSGPSSRATGGESGFLYLVTGTGINFGRGSVSMRGGDSSARGGSGGAISICIPNGTPGDVYVDTEIDCSSGNGVTRQTVGIAGSISITTQVGDIMIAGSITMNGGMGSGDTKTSGPSAGGLIRLHAGNGDGVDAGSITFRGSIIADGGTDSDNTNVTNGAPGGRLEFICNNPTGSIYLDPGSSIQLDGGAAGGPGFEARGGQGGTVILRTSGGSLGMGTRGGHISMRGTIAARGGSGGGMGGFVSAESDSATVIGGGDGRAGNITLHADGSFDLSGGPGTPGGGGLNDGGNLGATFPTAVFFDADGNNSNDSTQNGVVRNLGLIMSRGAEVNGNGGDVRFDGLNASLTVGPQPGNLDQEAAGTGIQGGFRSE